MAPKNIKLIVGSDSLVGKALTQYFEMSGEEVIGTTRCRDTVGQKHLYLDLLDNPESWSFPSGIDTAFICAGVTKLEECRRDPDTSRRVNVDGTCKLIKNLINKGIFVIYLSTNQVFDGSIPYCLPEEPFSPVTEYGRQKAETERLINQWKDSVTVVRFTKILGKENIFFSKWINDFKEDRAIYPFKDKYISPVSLSFAVSVLKLAASQKISGLLQVSGDKDISYADIACRIAELLKCDPKLVNPTEASKIDEDKETGGRYSTLNTNRLKSVLGIESPDVWQTIDTVIGELLTT
ncbi:MAG: sugar nucleotide-binding protein [Candidatus Omnitrophota bacterium]|nr:sugar nucleotide-binding protein [Candidatus Omnitrophota bacterium]